MNYKQRFKNYHNIADQDIILCWVCNRVGVDIHHIETKGMGGTNQDRIENLIALCRDCHNKAHSNELTKEELSLIVKQKL